MIRVKSFAGEEVIGPVLVQVVGPDVLRFGAGTRPVAEGYRLEVERPMAGRLVVERSWDLETWDPVWTEAPLEEVVRWLDDREGPAGAGARFYRCGLRAWD